MKSGLAGAFGYCLGGQSCLEHVRAGHPVQVPLCGMDLECHEHGHVHPFFLDFKLARELSGGKVAPPPSNILPRQAVCSLHGLLHSRPTTKEDPFNSQKRVSKEDYEKDLAVPNKYQKQCRSLAAIHFGDWKRRNPSQKTSLRATGSRVNFVIFV